MSSTVLAVLYAVHLLAAVVWIGGLVMLSGVVLPAARRVMSTRADAKTLAMDPVETVLAELERRFTPLANLSLVTLIATGMLQMSADENYGGFLQFANTWAWAMLFKHLAVIGMALIVGYVALVLEPERRRLQTLAAAKRPDDEATQDLARRRTRLAKLNLVCGLLTLVFTAIATAQ
jgi:putative copper resistance protein D